MAEPLSVDEWLRSARTSAEGRGLAELLPLLDAVAAAMRVVRETDWGAAPTGAHSTGDRTSDTTDPHRR